MTNFVRWRNRYNDDYTSLVFAEPSIWFEISTILHWPVPISLLKVTALAIFFINLFWMVEGADLWNQSSH